MPGDQVVFSTTMTIDVPSGELTRLDLEQTHLFAAMDFANASSDLDGALRIERLLSKLGGSDAS